MFTVSPNVILMLALSILLGACEQPMRKAEILPQYTEVQSCYSNKNVNELTNELLTHAVVRDKQLFPDSKITVFLIENLHASSFEASDTVSDSLRRIQSNVYYTLSDLDRLYCMEFLGHESVTSPITNIRDDANFLSLQTRLLNQYGHMEEDSLVEQLVLKGLGGAEIYSLLHLNHEAFIVDDYNPQELTYAVELTKIDEQLKSYVSRKYKLPEEMIIDSTIAEYQSKAAAIGCELYELFLERGFGAARNIIDLANELPVNRLAIVYGAGHTTQLQSVLSDSQVSHFILKPNGVGFVPKLEKVFSYCKKSQTK